MPIIDRLQCLYDIFHTVTHVTLTSLINFGGKEIHSAREIF